MPKFQLLSVSKSKPSPVIIDEEELLFTRQAKTLGLSLSRTGIVSHIMNRLAIAKRERQKLKRFEGMSSKLRVRLYKTLIRPILEYPVIPMCIASQSNKKVQQSFQNICLKQIAKGTDLAYETAERLHNEYDVEPYNVRQYNMAVKAWNRALEIKENLDVLLDSERETEEAEGARDHYWWRRVHPFIASPEPAPIII